MESSGNDAQDYGRSHCMNQPHSYANTLKRHIDIPQQPAFYQQPLLPDGQLVLVGLAAISKAVGAGPGTIKKWMKEEDFPVRRCSDGVYRASPEALKEWFARPQIGNA